MKNGVIFTKDEPFIGSMTGLVTVPGDFDPGKEKLPMTVFLHGAGEVGDGTVRTIEKVKVHGIPKYFDEDPCFRGNRVITASPQCIDGLIWDQLTIQTMDWIKAAAEKYGADMSRISLSGISMGGFGTWNLYTTYPDFFARYAPICGGGVSWRINEIHRGTKLRVFHSVDDDSVPFECSVLMVEAARRAGAYVEFVSYTDKGHGCWSEAYGETDLIDWLAFSV